jgi:hypothetical protein
VLRSVSEGDPPAAQLDQVEAAKAAMDRPTAKLAAPPPAQPPKPPEPSGTARTDGNRAPSPHAGWRDRIRGWSGRRWLAAAAAILVGAGNRCGEECGRDSEAAGGENQELS